MTRPRIFALSDPHLSFVTPKPMDVFGPAWSNHAERLAENWRARVSDADIVLMPGDISWAMRLADAKVDLEWLAALPGRKILLRGNHDYWWPSLKKLCDLGLPNMYFLQNNQVVLDGVAVGGSRLWDFPGIVWRFVPNAGNEEVAPEHREREKTVARGEDDDKIRERELERLRTSLGGLPTNAGLRVAMTHYPPLGEDGQPTPLTDLIGGFNIDICVFGHIHGHSGLPRPGEDVVIGKTRYILAASDHLRHAPLQIA